MEKTLSNYRLHKKKVDLERLKKIKKYTSENKKKFVYYNIFCDSINFD